MLKPPSLGPLSPNPPLLSALFDFFSIAYMLQTAPCRLLAACSGGRRRRTPPERAAPSRPVSLPRPHLTHTYLTHTPTHSQSLVCTHRTLHTTHRSPTRTHTHTLSHPAWRPVNNIPRPHPYPLPLSHAPTTTRTTTPTPTPAGKGRPDPGRRCTLPLLPPSPNFLSVAYMFCALERGRGNTLSDRSCLLSNAAPAGPRFRAKVEGGPGTARGPHGNR
jgi:hypothetical protein